jgi:hypothetical protein
LTPTAAGQFNNRLRRREQFLPRERRFGLPFCTRIGQQWLLSKRIQHRKSLPLWSEIRAQFHSSRRRRVLRTIPRRNQWRALRKHHPCRLTALPPPRLRSTKVLSIHKRPVNEAKPAARKPSSRRPDPYRGLRIRHRVSRRILQRRRSHEQ